MRKSSEHQPKGSTTENLLFGAVLAYSAGKATKDAIQRHRAERARFKAFLANEQAPIDSQPAEVVAETIPAPQPEKRVDGPAQRGLRSEASYFRSFFKTPMSIRKMLPRDGVYHAPWAYHQAPSYGSLHHDQSEYTRPGEYKTGMDNLVALGKQPLKTAIAQSVRENPNEPWRTLISEARLVQSVERAKDENSARRESQQLVGVLAAIEGIGFDTNDLAFAKWEAADAKFAVVPFDRDNELHQVVATVSNGPSIDTYADPGLMVRYVGSEHGRDISIDVRSVDIEQLRAEKGEQIPAMTPNPSYLSGVEYHSPGVLPSTQ